MRGRIRWALGLSAALLSASTLQAADLLEVYQRGVQNDPLLREAEANRLATRESKPRAISGLLPQVGAFGGYFDGSTDGTSIVPQQQAGGQIINVSADSTSDTKTKQWQLQLTQPVFRWDRWVTLKQANAQVAQAEADYQAAQQDLIVRVSQRYFDVLAAKDTVQSESTARDAIARQLEQAEKRFEVGLIAITDVQEAKAAHDNSAAAVIQAKRNLSTAQELLREIIGEDVEVLSGPGEQMPLQSPQPADEDQWIKTAMEQNLALISSRLAAEIARDTINIRRSGHLPTLDVVLSRSNRNVDGTEVFTVPDPTDPNAPPVTSTSPADSDTTSDQVALQLNFPIYSGGATQSGVREAVYLHRAARERLERTSRETERATRDAYLGVLSEMSRVKALRQALESSRTALQATEAGYEVGTRTTVDVLQARRTLAAAETTYARSRYDYIINIIQLKQAAGTLNAQDVQTINTWLGIPEKVKEPDPTSPSSESTTPPNPSTMN
jgi:outer membrane protein